MSWWRSRWMALAGAGLWGLAEGTLFFIVPDVGLTFLALKERRTALWASVWAAVGALVAGAVMIAWGQRDLEGGRRVMDALPAISPGMIAEVQTQLEHWGAWSLFVGPTQGVPYKLYALQSSVAGVSPLSLLALTPPARLLRFALLSWLTAWVASTWCATWSPRAKVVLLASLWIAFYTAYFLLKPN